MEHQRIRRRSSGDEEEDAMTVTFLWLRVYVVQAGKQFSNILWPKTLCGGRRTGEESWMARRSWLVVVTTQHAGTILCTRKTTSSYYTRPSGEGALKRRRKGRSSSPPKVYYCVFTLNRIEFVLDDEMLHHDHNFTHANRIRNI